MNKIFKVVWSKTKECYVVVSEVAKNNGGKKKALSTVFAALMAAGAMMPGQVDAVSYDAGGGTASGDTSIAIGGGFGATQAGPKANSKFSIAIGQEANATGDASIAMGHLAKTSGEESAIAIGNETKALSKDTTAVGSGSQSQGEKAAAFGFQSKALASYATALGSGALSQAEDSQAIGREAETSTSSFRGIAIGTLAKVNGLYGVAVGATSKATAESAVAVGYNTQATGYQSAAVGPLSKATNRKSTALGVSNTASGVASVATGAANTASGDYAAAYGAGNTASSEGSFAAGYKATATNKGSVAIGQYVNAEVGGTSTNPSVTSKNNGDYSTAVGYNSIASGENSAAYGAGAQATNKKATAVGNASVASGENSAAFGYNNTVTGDSSTALGTGNVIDNGGNSVASAVAVGHENKASGVGAIAIGKTNTSKVNDTITMGTSNTANTAGGIAIGKNNTADSTAGGGSSADNIQIAIGSDNQAKNEDTIAIGRENTADKRLAMAIGNRTEATGIGAVAIGSNGAGQKSISSGSFSVALGTGTNSTGTASTALGGKSQATADSATAVGREANASAESAIALGYKATASIKDGVALGSESKTTVNAGQVGYNPAAGRTNKYDNLTDNKNNVLTSNRAAVAIGDDDAHITRQLTGLAAGTKDTDAVNVAQLKAVNLKYAGNSGDSDVRLENGTLNIKGEGLLSTSADATGIKIEAKIGQITTNNDGKAVAPSTNGIATTDNVTQAINNSGWKVTSSNNGGTTNNTSIEKVSPGDKVTFSAGKNIVLDQNGKQFTYSLSDTVTLTNAGSLTVGDTKVNNGGVTITAPTSGSTTNVTLTQSGLDNGGNKIVNVKDGDVSATSKDAVNGSQLYAVKAAERHIKPTTNGTEYTVDNNGDVTMTYLDGNNNAVANEKAVIKGIAKNDLSNITNEGKKEITKLGTIVKAGDNVNVTSTSDGTTGQTTYTVNAVTPAVYTTADGTKVYKRPDGTFTTNKNLAAGNNVDKDDVITSFMDGNGNTTGGNMVVNNVGSAIKNAGNAGDSFLTKLDAANTATPNAAVNVSDLKNTADGLTDKGLKFNANEGGVKTNKLGSTVTVKGTGVLSAGKAYADEYNTANIRTNIEQGSDGNTTINVGLAKELKDINSISNGNSSITLNSNPGGTNNTPAVQITGGNLSMGNNKIVNVAPGTADTDAVNVKQLKDTELHITPGTYTPGTDKKVKLTYTDGNGGLVSGKEAVIDLSGLSTGGTTASSWNVKSSANTTDGGAVADTHDANAQNIANGKSVEFQSGKNLVVKQTNDTTGGNATVEFSLADNIVAGKDGANGKDGSVGATGKDGSSVVINGADGSIGMTGPKGQDGKDGINGRDGANISMTSAKGEQVLVNRDPAHNADTDKAERIVYVPKDASGNPIKDTNGKNIVREVATMDDGLKFTGNNTTIENKQKLGSLVKVQGEGTKEGTTVINPATGEKEIVLSDGTTKFESAKDNIAVVADGTDTLTVKLNKNLKGLDSVQTKTVVLGDPSATNGTTNITYNPTEKRIEYTTPGTAGGTETKKVATTDDIWTIQGDGTDVAPVNGKVNVKAGENILITTPATANGTMTINAVTPAVYTDKDGNKLTKDKDGKFHKDDGTEVAPADVITSIQDAAGHTTGGNSIVNNVGSAINNHVTPGVTSPTYLDKLDAAAGDTKTQNAAVNVTDLKNTADGLTDKGLKFNANEGGLKTNKLGSTVTVQGSGALTAGKAYADEYNTDNIRTNISQSNGDTVINVGLAKALKDINSISNGGSSITLNSNPGGTNNTPAVSITGGNVDVGGNNITNLKSGGNTDSNAANIGDVKKIAKDTDLHIATTAGGTNNVAEYTVDSNNKVTLTYQDGNGTAQSGPKAVIDLSALANKITSGYTFSTNATENGGKVVNDAATPAAETAVANGGVVNYAAGKNLTVKQDIEKDATGAATGKQTYTYALADEIGIGEKGQPGVAGKDGVDGKIGVNGKDGSSVVINGKDGSIGMTGPQGQNGKDGINGRDGANISMTSAKGEQVLINRDPAHSADNDKAERIVYVPKDANGDPIKGADNKNIVREVATMDDGLKFTGNNESTVNNHKLNTLVKVQGEGTKEGTNAAGTKEIQTSDGTKFESAKDNIAVEANNGDTLTVKLNKNLKGLDSVQTKTVELGDHTTPGGTTNITYNSGDKRIEYTTPGATAGTTETKKVATTDDIWTIQGNGTDVAPVNGKVNVKAGENILITTPTTADGSMTINAVTPAVYTDKNGNKLTKDKDGKFHKDDGTEVAAADVITSIQDAAGNVTGGNSIVNNVGSAIQTQTGGNFLEKLDKATDTTNPDARPNAVVNVSDLKNTADGLTDKGLKFNANEGGVKTNKLGSTVTVQGSGALTAGKAYADEYNTANIRTNISQSNGDTVINVGLAKALKDINSISNGGSSITLNSTPGGATNTPAVQITGGNLSMGDGTTNGNNKIVNLAPGTADTDAVNVKQLKDTELHITPGTYTPDTNKKVTLTYTNGNNQLVTGKEAVIDLSGLSTGGATASTWNVKSSANTTDGGAVGATHNANAQNIANGKTVEFQSGKNLVVNQTNDTTNGNATVEFSLSDKITVGKDGANGKDGSVGAKGADGSAVVMNGADGSIGLNGTNGANGISIKGKDGANGVGIDGKDGVTRIVYTEKVPDPANPSTTKEVTHEVATMDDGLKFTGNNTGTVNKHKLGSLVKVQGEGVSATDEAAFVSASGNIAVTAENNDTLTIRLNKNLKGLNSIQLGDNTIKSDGDTIKFDTKNSGTKTVATTDQLWTIQAGGVDVPAKSGKVNLVAGDHITITPDAANGKMTISATGFGSMDGFNVKTSAESATVGTHAGDTTENIKNGKTVDMQAGKNLVVTQTNDGNGNTTVNYALNKDVDLGTNGSLKTGDTTINNDGFKNGNTTVGGNGMTIKDPTDPTKTVSLTKDGLNNGGNQITNVASGGNVDTNAANIGDIKRLAKDTRIKDDTYTVDSNGTVELTYVDGAGNQVKDASGNAITAKITGITTLDSTRVNVAVNETGSGKAVGSTAPVKVTKGTEFVAGNNLIVERKAHTGNDLDNSVVYSLNSNLTGINSISNTPTGPKMTFGGNNINFTGGDVKISNGNLDMNNHQIKHVAPGTDGTDAVNLNQLNAARTKVTSNDGTVTVNRNENTATGEITYDLHVTPGQSPDLNRVNNRIDQLGEEIGRVGAQGAALSALKPIQYDPLEPTQIMAGYGNYRGNSALALGVAHYKNESTLIHGGVSWAGGSSHMMANAGVTWKVGNRDSEAAVADRYRKGPISSAYAMQQEMAAMKAQNAGLKGEVSDLKAENEQMKAQIAAMMAKLGL